MDHETPPEPIEAKNVYFLNPRSEYDYALIGYCERTHRAIYSRELLIDILINSARKRLDEHNAECAQEGDDEGIIEFTAEELSAEATDYYKRELLGEWLGEGTPLFCSSVRLRDD
tara:strand:- start:200 stop:544 length:345 start_codon:yes stop_codon:yes gene_type:complete